MAAAGGPQRSVHLRPGVHPGARRHRFSTADHPCAERRPRDHRAGLSRPPGLLGCGRAAVGPDGRPGLPSGQSPAGQYGDRRRAGDHRPWPDPFVQPHRLGLPGRRGAGGEPGWRADQPLRPVPDRRRPDPEARPGEGGGAAGLSSGPRRDRRAGLSGQPVELHPGRLRRQCRADPGGRRCAAGRRRPGRPAAGGADPGAPTIARQGLERPRAGRPPRRAGLLHRGRRGDDRQRPVEGPLQLQPHRRAPDRAKAAVGPARRGRGGAASLQHPRQRLRHRRGRLHRRHADHPGAGWPVARGLRLPLRDHPGRPVEGRPAGARRHGGLPGRQRRSGRGRREGAGRADRRRRAAGHAADACAGRALQRQPDPRRDRGRRASASRRLSSPGGSPPAGGVRANRPGS